MNSFTELLYKSMQCPSLPEKIKAEPTDGHCACCGVAITSGVLNKHCISTSMSQHGDFFRFGTHVCVPCAYLFLIPKIAHRNILATESTFYMPMISFESATDERKTWIETLKEIALLPAEAQITGVMTSDPKPRMWPRAELVTRDNFGLYIHCPEWDISGFRYFDLDKCLEFTQLIIECMALKFSKVKILKSLLSDYEKFKKHADKSIELEKQLQLIRNNPAFVPALMISGIKK